MSGLRSWTGSEFYRRGPAAATVLSPGRIECSNSTALNDREMTDDGRYLQDCSRRSGMAERVRDFRGCNADDVREMSVKYRPSVEMLRPTAAAAHCPYQHYPLPSPLYIGSVLFFNRPRSEGCHSMDVLSPFIPVLCHSDRLFHGESCPRLDVVHPGHAWSSSPSCTWHCSLHYLFLHATPLFPHGVTTVC